MRKPRCHPKLPYYAKGLCKRCYDKDAQRLYRLQRARTAASPRKP